MMIIMEKIESIQPKKIKSNDNIKIRGIVEIINSDNRIITENKFVQSMLAWLCNMTSFSNYSCAGSGTWNLSTSAWDIYLGTDQGAITNYNTTILSTPVGGGTGTAANIKTGSTSNPSNGVFRVTFTATWNPGVLGSPTIGEMALYLSIKNSLQSFGWGQPYGSATETKQLVSRLAVADGALTAFTINPINPVTINWTIQYSFS